MRTRGSTDKSPHIGRNYLRSKEANAVLRAGLAGSVSETKSCCG
jgi:hypothetical protein